MTFGKFYQTREIKIGNTILKNPSGYGGLFWGKVYDENMNDSIHFGSEYFIDLAKDNEMDDDFIYWDFITNCIEKHCEKYIDPLLNNDLKYHYQCGFGGDYLDGLIDFFTVSQVPRMPDLKFKIDDEKFTIKWEYSDGSD